MSGPPLSGIPLHGLDCDITENKARRTPRGWPPTQASWPNISGIPNDFLTNSNTESFAALLGQLVVEFLLQSSWLRHLDTAGFVFASAVRGDLTLCTSPVGTESRARPLSTPPCVFEYDLTLNGFAVSEMDATDVEQRRSGGQLQARVYCLVRGKNTSHCMKRIASACGSLRVDVEGTVWDRVVAVPGDITRHHFGLSVAAYGELLHTVFTALHFAARDNFSSPSVSCILHMSIASWNSWSFVRREKSSP